MKNNNKSQRSCPICKKPAQEKYMPFCSQRCADIDLGRWFSGDYRIALAPKDEEEEKELYNSIKERLDPDPNVG